MEWEFVMAEGSMPWIERVYVGGIREWMAVRVDRAEQMSTEKSIEERRVLERENMTMMDWVCKSTSMEG